MSGSDNLGVASRPAPVSAMIGTMVSGVDFLRNLTDRWIGRIPDIGHGSRGDHIRTSCIGHASPAESFSTRWHTPKPEAQCTK